MKENKYDDPSFFEKYSQMDRSQKGLLGAGEWHELKKLLPNFHGKQLLDLGCGFGWHCQYAMQHGAAGAVGVDISEKMLEVARQKNEFPQVEYIQSAIEDVSFAPERFDVVLSSLAFHYVQSFPGVCQRVHGFLKPGGAFVFSVEHPVFTAYGTQDWLYDLDGEKLCWPVDSYFTEGLREAVFLGEAVTKYHKTLTTYINGLLQSGFVIRQVVEPQPSEEMLHTVPGMKDELRRPMMLLVAAAKA